MEYRKDIWFAPRKIIASYYAKEAQLGVKFTKDKNFKAMREVRAVAIMMLGIMKRLGRAGWVQLVDPTKESTPDVRTGFARDQIGEDNKFQYQDVEVVTLTSYSKEPVEKFIEKTKLSNSKKYQEDTIILCYVDTDVKTNKWTEIQKYLSKTKAPYDIYLLGKIKGDKLVYQLARVHPALDQIVKFDLEEELKKDYGTKNHLRYVRSTKKSSIVTGENYQPF